MFCRSGGGVRLVLLASAASHIMQSALLCGCSNGQIELFVFYPTSCLLDRKIGLRPEV